MTEGDVLIVAQHLARCDGQLDIVIRLLRQASASNPAWIADEAEQAITDVRGLLVFLQRHYL